MNANTITTGKGRFSYAHLFEPTTAPGSTEAKYSLSFPFPKSDTATMKKIEAAIEAAKEIGKTKKWGGKIPAKLHLPIRDGDEDRPDDPAYAGCYFFNCSCKNKPAVVDANLNHIIDPNEVYSGCYGRVNISFYPYDTNGNRGIAVGLNSVQKLADGEPLGGSGVSVEAAFGEDDDLFE